MDVDKKICKEMTTCYLFIQTFHLLFSGKVVFLPLACKTNVDMLYMSNWAGVQRCCHLGNKCYPPPPPSIHDSNKREQI